MNSLAVNFDLHQILYQTMVKDYENYIVKLL